MSDPFIGPDGQPRCRWCGAAPEFLAYHDTEWGVPEYDDRALYEKLVLDGFQAGLAWITILRKRENFRKAFDGFAPEKIARYTPKKIEKLMQDAGIIRHRGKIVSTINNAKRALELRDEFGSLAAYFWSQEPDAASRPSRLDYETLRTLGKTEESTAISKDLKKRGWSFVGPTTVYAFMQAMGLINDHVEDCVTRAKVEKARKRFKRPGG